VSERPSRTAGTDIKVLEFIRAHVAAAGYPPTQREIRDAVGVSLMSVNRSLHRLVETGQLVIHPGLSPRLQVVDMKADAANLDPARETM
jgi:SOS-response transcriptional repressor LexA